MNTDKLISVIIPMKNEKSGIDDLFNTLIPIVSMLPIGFQIVCINDGSNDGTLDLLLTKQLTLPQLKIIDLSRNFGKEAAVYAGFANADGDCAVILDADLQDPPQLIIEMVEMWLQGYEVVTAVRNVRDSDSFAKRSTANLFYKIINSVSETKMTPNAGDYRLLDRCAINAFLDLTEKVRFNKGLFSWLGFKEKIIFHERHRRAQGHSKWNYFKLFKFAIDGITSFSKAPLEIWFYLGIMIASCGFLYALYYFIKTIVFGIDVHGYPSLLMFILFFSGLQMIGIGVLGKYIGRIFIESKQRPLYIIRKIYDKCQK